MNKQVRSAKPEAFCTSKMFPRLTFLVLFLPLVLFTSNLNGQCTQTISDFTTQSQERFENNSLELWGPVNDISTSNSNTGGCPQWTRSDGGTPSSNTGPGGAQQGNFYVFTEASSPCFTSDFYLNGPCFDFTRKENARIVFLYHMNGNNIGTLALEASTDGGASWSEVWSLSGNQGNQWTQETVSLDAYHEQTVQLRFHGNSLSFASDMALDNIRVRADERPCQWVVVGEDIFYDCDNVGIGTNTPTAKLDVRGITSIGTTDSRNYLEIKSRHAP